MQINKFYEHKHNKDNVVMYVLRITKRGKERILHVEWYTKIPKIISMGLFQDVVVNIDTFEDEWKMLNY